MVGKMTSFVAILAIAGSAATAMAGDVKNENNKKEGDKPAGKAKGFTDGHGTVFGVDTTSRKLYELLVGEKVDAEHIECSICKEALKTNGVCTEHKIGMVHGTLYRCPFAYTLALGEPVDPAKTPKCSGCKEALAKNGFCKECKVGFVAHRKFKNFDDHYYALSALEQIKKAAAKVKECETCAIAIATNGNCPKCKTAYRYQRAAP